MKERYLDSWISLSTITLLIVGIIMVYSSSAFYAEKVMGNHFYYLGKQLLWVLAGIGCAFLAYLLPLEKIKGKTAFLYFVALSLLIILIFKRPARWLHIGFINVQGSDVARFALTIFLADSLSRKKKFLKSFGEGVLPHMIYVGLFFLLIMFQPDLSSSVAVALIGVLMMAVSDIPKKYIFTPALFAIPVGISVFWVSPYQIKRISAFLNPESDPLGYGYQVIQSLISVGSGGILGKGFAQSSQKLMFLPEAHTDFIFAIISEEWGLLGALVVLTLFFILMWRGFQISYRARDDFYSYLAFGLTMNIVVYALINMAVVVNLCPPTGLPLPFISYGGSSLITNATMIGLLLNVAHRVQSEKIRNHGAFANRARSNYMNRKLRYVQ